jgi:putative SOS response-associated peptidase YedK
MCGRYSLFLPREDIEERFDATFAESFQPRYNAAPSQSLPVIADETPETIDTKEWGLVPPWADDRSDFGYINARAETLSEKPTFRDAFEGSTDGDLRVGRCLVPADGFYEWVESAERRSADTQAAAPRNGGGKQPYRVTLAGEEPFAMAGLWAQWRPPQTQTGLDAFAGGGGGETGPEIVETFTVVTTEPNDLVADLHHRMAVILPEGREREWLTGSVDEARELLAPYPSDEMQAYPVSTAVNDPSNDTPAVTERVELE